MFVLNDNKIAEISCKVCVQLQPEHVKIRIVLSLKMEHESLKHNPAFPSSGTARRYRLSRDIHREQTVFCRRNENECRYGKTYSGYDRRHVS